MCGICGIVTWAPGQNSVANSEGRINAMIDALMHRGPDETGNAHWRNGSFGMTRLAIRGFNDGKQPIVDAETGVVMVCNGEIDNHQLLRLWLKDHGMEAPQSSDVAVILPLYLTLGEDFVSRLQGAFAIAIWDPRHDRLLLARDRAGERPLFYIQRGFEVSFASLIAALCTPNDRQMEICQQSIQGFLQRGYFSAPSSPLQNVQKVFPGEIICFHGGYQKRKRYWQWAIVNTPKKPTNLDQFDQLFRAAVKRQSDVDVDFGLFLSGGLDSSLIAAVTKSIHPDKKLKAYCLRFNEVSYDEGMYAELVAQLLGVEFVPVWPKPEDFPITIQHLIRQIGEPLADPAWVPCALLAKRAAEDICVALVGEGADELFAGYPTYFGASLAGYYVRLPAMLRNFIRITVNRFPPSDKKVTLLFLLKRFIQGDDLDYLSRHLLWTSSITPPLLERLGMAAEPLARNEYPSREMLDRLQLYDLENLLAEGLLTKADRGGMKSALELRSPFLDQAVMEFASGLPKSERIDGIKTKVILKQYALRYLPKKIVYRKKRGLSIPLSSWLREPFKVLPIVKTKNSPN